MSINFISLCVYMSLSFSICREKENEKCAHVSIIFQMHALMTIYHERVRDKNIISLPLLLFANAGHSLV